MSFGGGFSQQMLSRDDIKTLEKVEHVSDVTPIYNASAKYVTREGQKRYQAGIEPHNSAIKQDVLAGSTENLQDDQVIYRAALPRCWAGRMQTRRLARR